MENRTVKIAHNGLTLDIKVDYRIASQDLLVFLHGIGCSKRSFRDIWTRADFDPFSLLAMDFIGFGETEGYDNFSYFMTEQADICGRVINALFQKPRLHIIAHSMGGAIGLLLPEDILNSAASFVSVEGNLIKEDCFLTEISRDFLFNIFETKIFPNFTSEEDFLTDEDLTDDQKELIKTMRKYQRDFSLDQTSPYAFHRSSDSLVKHSDSGKLLEIFKALNCKKSYFYGDRDSDMDILHDLELITDIHKVSIGASGHFIMNDNPDAFYSRLLEFLPL